MNGAAMRVAPASLVTVVPSHGGLGADIEGLDLAQPMDASVFEEVRSAWHAHSILRFRNQDLTYEQLIGFSKRFGALDPAPTGNGGRPPIPQQPELNVISNVVENGKPVGGLGNSELVWHQDMTYNDIPPKACLLYGVEVPASGGDTEFASLHLALESLPSDLRTRLQGLSCKHDATRNSSGQLRVGYAETYSNEDRPGAVHPFIVTHPESGRPMLCLGQRNNAWITGMPAGESEALLDEVWAHIEQSGAHWVQQWQPGDLILWDNRSVLHRRGRLDPSERRYMLRTQVRATAGPGRGLDI